MNEIILLAVGQDKGGSPGLLGIGGGLFPLVIMFGIFYFLLIRPQQKRQREHQAILSRLKKGDRVVTNGGLIGTIYKLTENELDIEIADRVKVKVLRQQVNLAPDHATDVELKGK